MQPRSLTVHDFLVEFPREPYPLQMDVMAKVLTAVKKRRDAVIESPTGTGKSLALLCSTLAYVRSQPDVTCVVYASRTHAQLQQVMREFQSTAYADRMRAVTLSSREGHCLHADVKNRTGVDQVAACRSLLSKRRCHYRNNVSRVGAEDPDIHALLSDLEDIHLTFPLLKERMLCPYYLAHSAHIVNSAQLVLMPYNYVLDPAARHSVKLDWSKTIVVFDEAHNVEAACEEFSGFALKLHDVVLAERQVERLAKLRWEQDMEHLRDPKVEVTIPLTRNALAQLRKTLDRLHTVLQEYRAAACAPPVAAAAGLGSSPRRADKGGEWFRVLAAAGLEGLALPGLLTTLERLVECEATGLVSLDKLELMARCIARSIALGRVNASTYSPEQARNCADSWFRLYVSKATEDEEEGASQGSGAAGSSDWLLQFWCFSPHVAIQDVRRLGVFSMIFASGTLSPLQSFATSLGLAEDFEQLESDHIVARDRVFLGALRAGVQGGALDVSFKLRAQAYPELGETVLALAGRVPDGVLVFFPSYAVLGECVAVWRRPVQAGAARPSESVWDRLVKAKSVVVAESKGGSGAALLARYEQAVDAGEGALLLAVCRGRLSEGMDFKDARARAVILIGVPYPAAFDVRVVEKRAFLDRAGNSECSGSRWYNQQAYRACNQAAGRVVRHAMDFGAILLLDLRFAGFKDNLSRWLRPSFVAYDGAAKAMAELEVFFKRLHMSRPRKLPPRPVAAVAAAPAALPRAERAAHLLGTAVPFRGFASAFSPSTPSAFSASAVSTSSSPALCEQAPKRPRPSGQPVLPLAPTALPIARTVAVRPAGGGAAAATAAAPPALSAADRLLAHRHQDTLDTATFIDLVRRALEPAQYAEFIALLKVMRQGDRARSLAGTRARLEALFAHVEGGPALLRRLLLSLPSAIKDRLW